MALSIACLDEGKSLLGNGLHHTSRSATPWSHAIENGFFVVASVSYFPAVRGDPVMPQFVPHGDNRGHYGRTTTAQHPCPLSQTPE